jgi:hypothetical protein
MSAKRPDDVNTDNWQETLQYLQKTGPGPLEHETGHHHATARPLTLGNASIILTML